MEYSSPPIVDGPVPASAQRLSLPHGLALEAAIHSLRRDMNAVILAHYYQDDAIQDIADYVGDSLDLSRKAAATDADVIVFCGVKFMAEGAKIISPDKQVLLPDLKAGCSLEDSCPPEAFAAFRQAHPDHLALTYINCSAEVKALSDIIVTSTNAEAIINQIPPEQKIIFAPDRHLGAYLSKKTGRDMLLWNGACMVHERFSEEALVKLRERYPAAHIIAHPECPEALLAYAHHIGSTSSLIRYTQQHAGQAFIVLTEPGILHQMRQQSTGSVFYAVPGLGAGCEHCNNCPYMKLNTLEKIYLCMQSRSPEILLPDALMVRARQPLERMLEMSRNIPHSGNGSIGQTPLHA
ncbi:MAG: quinolinate synthase NadA [Rickettsiales bacterium]|nr:quinolinate synthase NadA [Rickettsiales bacterium]